MITELWTPPIRLLECIAAPTATELAVEAFAPIARGEMGKSALRDRIETQHLVPIEALPVFLDAIRADYRVLTKKGRRLQHQQRLDFDFSDFALFLRQHAGAADRDKLRASSYDASGENVLLVKHRDNKGRWRRTRKLRFVTDSQMRAVDPKSGELLRHRYRYRDDLVYGRLLTSFDRVTLVHRQLAERITIDLDLRFEGAGRVATLSEVTVIEIARVRHGAESSAVARLRRQRMRPQRFSKYGIGVSLVYPQIKHNRYKPTLRQLDTLFRGVSHAH
jgi:hypothetical protein